MKSQRKSSNPDASAKGRAVMVGRAASINSKRAGTGGTVGSSQPGVALLFRMRQNLPPSLGCAEIARRHDREPPVLG